MNPFYEAARKAVENYWREVKLTEEYYKKTGQSMPNQIGGLPEHIMAAHADLRATYDALCDCVECLLVGRATNGYLSPHWQAEMNRRLENPIIQAAIERSKGNAKPR